MTSKARDCKSRAREAFRRLNFFDTIHGLVSLLRHTITL
jgi:hypothetical protein